MIRTYTLALAGLAAVTTSLAVPATATPAPTPGKSEKVIYADLDLGTASGVRTLHHRIGAAIEDVCGDPSTTNLDMGSVIQACSSRAKAEVAPQMARVTDGMRHASTEQADLVVAAR